MIYTILFHQITKEVDETLERFPQLRKNYDEFWKLRADEALILIDSWKSRAG